MKICRVSQTYPTVFNEGKGLHAFNISNLIKEPTLILTKFYDEKYLKPESHVKIKKIKYMQYPFPPSKKELLTYILAVLSYIIGQIEFAVKSIKPIITFKPDIVHLQSPHAFLIGFIGKLLGAKVVVTFHGSDLRRVSKNKLFMFFLKKFDAFYYVSNDMKPILEQYFSNKKILFTPSGVDIDFFKDIYSLDSREDILLSVGNIRWQKSFCDLVEAFYIIHDKFPNYKLVIIGRITEMEEEKKLLTKIKEYKLEDSIDLLGYQDKFIIREYMSKSKLFLLSSITEGMPKVILESFACNLPVVATDVGECKLLVKDSGKIVPKSEPKIMATNVIEILSNNSKYNDFIENINNNANIFSWKNNAKRILNYFNGMK